MYNGDDYVKKKLIDKIRPPENGNLERCHLPNTNIQRMHVVRAENFALLAF